MKHHKGLTIEQSALMLAGLNAYKDLNEVQKTIDFLANSLDEEDQQQRWSLFEKKEIAQGNLELLKKELGKPSQLIKTLKYQHNSELLDPVSIAEWSTTEALGLKPILSANGDGDNKKLLKWKLKSFISAEETALIITGLIRFDSLEEAGNFVREHIEHYPSFDKKLKEVLGRKKANISLFGNHQETLKDANTFVRKEGGEALISKYYKIQLIDAIAIKQAIEMELSINDSSALKAVDDNNKYITKENAYSWCKSRGINLQHWHKVFPSDNENSEREKVSSIEAPDKETEGPKNGIAQDQRHSKTDSNLSINRPKREDDLCKMMIAEMEGAYQEQGKILTQRELFNRILKNENNDCDYGKGSDSLIQITGRETDFDAFKKRYASYFNSGD